MAMRRRSAKYERLIDDIEKHGEAYMSTDYDSKAMNTLVARTRRLCPSPRLPTHFSSVTTCITVTPSCIPYYLSTTKHTTTTHHDKP